MYFQKFITSCPRSDQSPETNTLAFTKSIIYLEEFAGKQQE